MPALGAGIAAAFAASWASTTALTFATAAGWGTVATGAAMVGAGALAGAAAGALGGGITAELTGGEFSEGMERGALTGAITGGVIGFGNALGAAYSGPSDGMPQSSSQSKGLLETEIGVTDAQVMQGTDTAANLATEAQSQGLLSPGAVGKFGNRKVAGTPTTKTPTTKTGIGDKDITGVKPNTDTGFKTGSDIKTDIKAPDTPGVDKTFSEKTFNKIGDKWDGLDDWQKYGLLQIGGSALSGYGKDVATDDRRRWEEKLAEERRARINNLTPQQIRETGMLFDDFRPPEH